MNNKDIAFRDCNECRKEHGAVILPCEIFRVCKYDPRYDKKVEAHIDNSSE